MTPPTPPVQRRQRTSARLLAALATLLALLLAACATTGTPSTAGTVRVTIRGLPAGVDADVTVTGAGSFNRDLTASANLPGLTPGTYTVSAVNVSDGGDAYSATVTGSPASVTTGTTTTVTVTYRTGVGSLQVDISGLPAGTDADVTVTSPGGFSESLTASDTLTGLEPGDYTVTAADLPGTTAYQATPATTTVTVDPNATATSTVTYAAVAGTLDLTVSGLPGSVDAAIVVSEPGGFQQLVTGDETLTGLVPGRYTVSSANVDSLATYTASRYLASAPLQFVDVVSDVTGNVQASVASDYRLATSSGHLWISIELVLPGIAPAENLLEGFAEDQLAASSTDVVPDVRIGGSPAGANPGRENGITFDADGNLWLVDSQGDQIRVYSSAKLIDGAVIGDGVGATAVVDLVVESSDLDSPTELAFDSEGNLWVSNATAAPGTRAPGTVVRFAHDDLLLPPLPAATTTSRTLSPDAVIENIDVNGNNDGSGTLALLRDDTLINPSGIGFDADGNLWVANPGNNSVARFDAAAIASGGALPPSIRITEDNGLLAPADVAFDADGNLWISNGSIQDDVVRFDAAALGSLTGTTRGPDGITSSDPATRDEPSGLAFDHSGNLWLVGHLFPDNSTQRDDNLVRFDDPGAIDGSATATADAVIRSGDMDNGGLAFFPPPAGLPIHTPSMSGP